MGQIAPRVCTDAAAIRKLETWIERLPAHTRVTVTTADGNETTGVVCIRPTVQSLRDVAGVEGVNGVLRLEDAAAPTGEHRIWLDQIRDVRRHVTYQVDRPVKWSRYTSERTA